MLKAKEAGVCCAKAMAAAIAVLAQEEKGLMDASMCYLPPPSASSHGVPSGLCYPHSVRFLPLSATVLHDDPL